MAGRNGTDLRRGIDTQLTQPKNDPLEDLNNFFLESTITSGEARNLAFVRKAIGWTTPEKCKVQLTAMVEDNPTKASMKDDFVTSILSYCEAAGLPTQYLQHYGRLLYTLFRPYSINCQGLEDITNLFRESTLTSVNAKEIARL